MINNLQNRQAVEARGGPDAPKILQVQVAAGGTWQLISIESGTKEREAQLKERGASRRCFLCVADDQPGELGWVYVLHLDPPGRAGKAAEDWEPAHRVGFTTDTRAVLAATKNAGQDAARVLGLGKPRAGRWRFVCADWAPRSLAQEPTEKALASDCPACTDKARAGYADLLAAIERGEVADRRHPQHGLAARWHTRDGRPNVTSGRGGEQGRNVTAAMLALVERGLAVRSHHPRPNGDYPYEITGAGMAVLQEARAGVRRPAGRADGLPANRDGSLSRSRTTDEEKRDAGVQTTPQRLEHELLRALDHPRPATRVRGPLPDDDWTVIPAVAADPSWPSGIRVGVAAAARRPARPAGRRGLSRDVPALPRGSRQPAK